MSRANHHTAFAATLAVGAELSRRGYDVTLTLGNTPRIDLMCIVPDGQEFTVQVKGISGTYGFWVQEKFFTAPLQSNLFLVVVVVARVTQHESPPIFRFFILSHAEAKKEGAKMSRPFKTGLNWGSITPYEDHWETLPPSAV